MEHHTLHRLCGQAHSGVLLNGAAFVRLGLKQIQEDVEFTRRRLRIIDAGDDGGEHVGAIVTTLGVQPVLDAAALAVDQWPRPVGLRIFVVRDWHECEGMRQGRHLEGIGVERVWMSAQMWRGAFQHCGNSTSVLGRNAPLAAIGLARR
jgi:hypothetical protein